MAIKINYSRWLINVLASLFTMVQCLSPMAIAQTVLDLDPPNIVHVTPTQFKSGSEVTVEATVTDDNGVDEVIVYYRIATQGAYVALPMTNSGNKYTAVLQTERRQSVLQYYIEAVDSANNRLVEGSPAAPLSVAAIAGKKEKSNILYIVLGALAIGGLAAAAGGGGDDDAVVDPNTTPLTLTVPTP